MQKSSAFPHFFAIFQKIAPICTAFLPLSPTPPHKKQLFGAFFSSKHLALIFVA